MIDFSKTFEDLTGHPPFPWQERLYERFMQNDTPGTCLLPTGLGKTSVIAIWLIALANNSKLPRRLVYVVNRRTVVDQTTTEVERLRENLPECPDLKNALESMCALKENDSDADTIPLAISTLRGQYADNQEWSQDPARPAVICGTVDMIGSRLLFSGYRCGFKSKPMQAGFLGQDALLVHDEAHLESAFQKLVEEIQKEQVSSQEQQPLQVMALSATARAESESAPFELDEKDHKHKVVLQRITAAKELHLHPLEDEKKELVGSLVDHAMSYSQSGKAVLVFARTVETVEKVVQAIEKELRKLKLPKDVEALTGTMRGLERNQLVKRPVFDRFLPPSDQNQKTESDEGTVYLVCTSAGEVGVNITADHLVCDLSTYESMAQRLGRVNRFGDCEETEVHVFHPTEFSSQKEAISKPELTYDVARGRTLRLLQELNGSASLQALDGLDSGTRQAAFSPDPEHLNTSDILFDAWANTTIRDLPGRPPVEEYLHGKAEWEPSRTEVAWREEVELLSENLLKQLGLSLDELLADYPLKPHEILTDRSDRIFDRLKKLHDRIVKDFRKAHSNEESPEVPVWITNNEDKTTTTTLANIVNGDKKAFSPQTILLASKFGGLGSNGLFDPGSDEADDVADQWQNEDGNGTSHRERGMGIKYKNVSGMRLIRSIQTVTSPDLLEESSSDELSDAEKAERSIWYWHVRPKSADDDGSKAAQLPIEWPLHTEDVVAKATQIANELLVDAPEIQQAMILAARFHDFGKRRIIWQRSIGNPKPTDWHEKSGKEEGWGRVIELTRYRHEFGSLLNLLHPEEEDQKEFVTAFSEFTGMTEEQQDIVLHLIAVHHGYGRPHFPPAQAFDPDYEQSVADELAREIPRRFARLQRKFGRWGLAWLESLFRAADWAASAKPTLAESVTENEVTE